MSVEEIDSIPVKLSEKHLLDTILEGEDGKVSQRTKTQLKKAIREVLSHIKPQGIYRIIPLRSQKDKKSSKDLNFSSKNLKEMFNDCDKVAVFLTTVGKEIDDLVKKAMKRRPHYGYLLNLVASAAAEEAAEYMQEYIRKKLPEDRTTTYRYSPGYCDWSIREQKKLFGLIPHEKIGVKLSDTYLMSPTKSVSGVFGICNANSEMELRNLCRNCKRKNCPHRRV